MGALKRASAALAIALVLASSAVADTRKDNIDVIIALDKSLSMEKKIGAVKSWVNSFILDQLIIPGDFLTVIAFYGKQETVISQTINSDADRSAAKAVISKLIGDGRFTDIGNALDAVKAQLADKENDGRQKYVLLLTDGIQEAPPTSKYYSKNGTFNHEFLANTKTIQQKGWKVMILGIGIDTAAKALAQELQGSYSEISNKLTPETITQKAGTLFGMPSVEGAVTLAPINQDGTSQIAFTLKPSGLAGDIVITVSDASTRSGSREMAALLPSPFTFTVKKDGASPVRIPLRFPPGLQPGSTSGTLTFTFGSTERFAPAEVPVTLHVMGWVQSNPLLLGGAALVALLLAGLIIFVIWRFTRGKPLHFSVLIDDAAVQEQPSALHAGQDLFLNDTASVFSLVSKRNAKSVAKLSVARGKLALTVLKVDRFPKVKEFPPDIRGKSFPMRAESGTTVTLKIQSKERK